MEDKRYARLILERLASFRKSGEPLSIVDSFRNDNNIIECALCGWPSTSDTTDQKSLRNVYILKNHVSGKHLFVGSNCAKVYQRFINESEPLFKINNLAMVNKFPSADHKVDLRSYDMAFYVPYDEYLEDLEYTEDYDDYQDYANYQDEIIYDIIDDIYSEENLTYFFEDDDYLEIKLREDPQRFISEEGYTVDFDNDEDDDD